MRNVDLYNQRLLRACLVYNKMSFDDSAYFFSGPHKTIENEKDLTRCRVELEDCSDSKFIVLPRNLPHC
jgi:hypothetical protein